MLPVISLKACAETLKGRITAVKTIINSAILFFLEVIILPP
jgi:hypothetical protein